MARKTTIQTEKKITGVTVDGIKYYDRDTFSKVYGIKWRTIYNYVATGAVISIKIGNGNRFFAMKPEGGKL